MLGTVRKGLLSVLRIPVGSTVDFGKMDRLNNRLKMKYLDIISIEQLGITRSDITYRLAIISTPASCLKSHINLEDLALRMFNIYSNRNWKYLYFCKNLFKDLFKRDLFYLI